MDIVNRLSEPRFAEIDDFLAFVSIYDDEARTAAYLQMLRRRAREIAGRVAVEAGCGFGVIAAEMARLGARRVYAVESNASMQEIAAQNLAASANVSLVRSDLRAFRPPEPVDLLVHDFFGPLLYDEDLSLLDALPFAAGMILPDRARLVCGCARSAELCDDVVTPSVLARLDGVLVSGLFDDEPEYDLPLTVAEWTAGHGLEVPGGDVSAFAPDSDVLVFGLEIYDGDRLIARSGHSSNWSYVFTPRTADRFRLDFEHNGRFMEAVFGWVG
jgi:SAM-dependent methyltransferase